jgi:hypothetical protein
MPLRCTFLGWCHRDHGVYGAALQCELEQCSQRVIYVPVQGYSKWLSGFWHLVLQMQHHMISSCEVTSRIGLCSSPSRKYPGTEGTSQNRHWNRHRWHATNIFKVNHIFRISDLFLHVSALQERHLQGAQNILMKLCVRYVISAKTEIQYTYIVRIYIKYLYLLMT